MAPDAVGRGRGERLIRESRWSTSLLALLGDGGQCRTDGLALFGEGAGAGALGVTLWPDQAGQLAGDASREEVRANVRRAQVEADLAHGARRVTEPRRDAVVTAAELERQIALLVVPLAFVLGEDVIDQ